MLFIYSYMSHFNIKMLHINLMINVDIFNTYLVITYLACTARYLLLPPRFHTFSRTIKLQLNRQHATVSGRRKKQRAHVKCSEGAPPCWSGGTGLGDRLGQWNSCGLVCSTFSSDVMAANRNWSEMFAKVNNTLKLFFKKTIEIFKFCWLILNWF